MKIISKRIFGGIGIISILIVILIVTYGIRANSAMKQMTPVGTQEVVENIFAIQDSYVNLFLIKNVDKYIAIDCGNNVENVEEGLQKLKINSDDVVAIFLTHTDFDHVAALDLFKNATVYFSKFEEQMINGEQARFFSIAKNKINTQNYELLDDGQVLTLNDLHVRGISNPGHTLGSMSYLVNNTYLFTGDALRLKDNQIVLFFNVFNMDTETAKNSINKLVNIDGVEYLFTAHSGYSDNFNLLANQWRK